MYKQNFLDRKRQITYIGRIQDYRVTTPRIYSDPRFGNAGHVPNGELRWIIRDMFPAVRNWKKRIPFHSNGNAGYLRAKDRLAWYKKNGGVPDKLYMR